MDALISAEDVPYISDRIRFLYRVLYPNPVMTAIQVETMHNRVFAMRAGLGDDLIFPRPYKNSVRAKCEFCRGDVLIGPLVYQHVRARARENGDDAVFCLLCTGLLFGLDNVRDNLVLLSRKGAGE